MDILEKVEKIREKTGVSYEDAKAALEQSNEDVLDALVYLEAQGKIKKPQTSAYSTKAESSQEFKKAASAYDTKDDEKFGDILKRFAKWCGELIKKGCENFFVVSKGTEEIITLPVLAIVLLLLGFFWIIVPLMIVGLFFGFTYKFRGDITKAVDVNTVCDKAAEAAESVKQEFTKNE